MTAPAQKPSAREKQKIAPNGKPVRYYQAPDSLAGKLKDGRFILARRVTQITLLLLFYGTFHWAWSIAERPVLAGNPSASLFLGVIPMSDPFATLQIWLTGHVLESTALIGAGLILVFYALVGGRVWCAWFCPVNMITDLAGWSRNKLGIRNVLHLNRYLRYYVLSMALVLSAITGVAAFEWVSPIGIAHRGVIYGLGLGWMALLGIFLFDLFVLRHGWCGHLCPLGAFYAVVGRISPIRVAFDSPTCTHCGECARVCPEPQVLNLKQAAEAGLIQSGECSNCLRCLPVCPEDTLSLQWRTRASNSNNATPEEGQ